jgi:hypothetical protein
MIPNSALLALAYRWEFTTRLPSWAIKEVRALVEQYPERPEPAAPVEGDKLPGESEREWLDRVAPAAPALVGDALRHVALEARRYFVNHTGNWEEQLCRMLDNALASSPGPGLREALDRLIKAAYAWTAWMLDVDPTPGRGEPLMKEMEEATVAYKRLADAALRADEEART